MKLARLPTTEKAEAWEQTKKEFARKRSSKRRYARINKNLLIQVGSLGLLVREKNLTGRGLVLLLNLVADAQLTERQGLPFRTDNDWLHRIGVPVTFQEREAMYTGLSALRTAELKLPWFHAEETRRVGLMSDKVAKRRIRKKRRAKQTRYRVIKGILQFRIRIGGGFSVRFTDEFWDIISLEKFYSKMYLQTAVELRQPHIILLAGLLDAMGGQIRMYPETLARRIGLKPGRRARNVKSIKLGLLHIQEASGQRIRIWELKRGKLVIERGHKIDI